MSFQFHIEYNVVIWKEVFHSLLPFSTFFPYSPYILQVNLWSPGVSTFQTTIPDPLPSPTPAS